jgi:hypothetical protein
MRNSLFYSKHCAHCVQLITRIASNSSLADSMVYVSVDEPNVRNLLYVLGIDRVPTLVLDDKHYVGDDAFRLISNTKPPEVLTSANEDGPYASITLPTNGRPEMPTDGKISDNDLEEMLARRKADIITPPTPPV